MTQQPQVTFGIFVKNEDASGSPEGPGRLWIKKLNDDVKVWVSKNGADADTYEWHLIYDSQSPATGLSQSQVDARIIALAASAGVTIPFTDGRIYAALTDKSAPADYVEADFTSGSSSDSPLINIPAATANSYLAFAVPVSGGQIESIIRVAGFNQDNRDDYGPAAADAQIELEIAGVMCYVYVSLTELTSFFLLASREYRLSQAGS